MNHKIKCSLSLMRKKNCTAKIKALCYPNVYCMDLLLDKPLALAVRLKSFLFTMYTIADGYQDPEPTEESSYMLLPWLPWLLLPLSSLYGLILLVGVYCLAQERGSLTPDSYPYL